MPKTRIIKEDGGMKVAEVKRNIKTALNPGNLKDRETCRLQKGSVVFSFSSNFKHLQPRWKSSAYSEEQNKRYFTTRSRRSYQ